MLTLTRLYAETRHGSGWLSVDKNGIVRDWSHSLRAYRFTSIESDPGLFYTGIYVTLPLGQYEQGVETIDVSAEGRGR